MVSRLALLVAIAAAQPISAEETRQLDAHEHGVGELNIAMDGTEIAMEFHAPGSDIVGFEYEAESAEDLAAIEAAMATLSDPLKLFAVPDGAGCAATKASVVLLGDEDHDEHDDHGHDDHGHDDHGHEDHAEAEHGDDAGHTEFKAEYSLTCANASALTAIAFPYFELFPNAREVEVQLATPAGAQAFEVTREAPQLDLSGMF